ncbi:hypothetical protein SUBVAR_06466 [Subdoligranulum variabile DSM 15176]|uniref:Uncharacterized protein n=1 Tax=Subdoligranulum variabile DSM 15176 TaxID=411471 RepID=D1PPZ9_9FIRM|nr:hypothetical protein SUBVAR_06466 [Subdoligranulum variabile DSM 15176]
MKKSAVVRFDKKEKVRFFRHKLNLIKHFCKHYNILKKKIQVRRLTN